MLIRWATRGGVRKGGWAGTHLPPVGSLPTSGLAAAGLIIWIIYLVADSTILAWIAVVDLVIIAIIGVVMVRQWAKDGRAAMAASAAGAGGANAGAVETRRVDAGTVDLAEQHIHGPPVVLHGIFAVSTLILVLLTALGLGPGS